MKETKFTKEQFLLLAECEYVFCDNIDKLNGVFTDSEDSKDYKKEIESLIQRAEEIMPDVVESHRAKIKSIECEIPLCKKMTVKPALARTFFLATKENIELSNAAGFMAILYTYDALREDNNG